MSARTLETRDTIEAKASTRWGRKHTKKNETGYSNNSGFLQDIQDKTQDLQRVRLLQQLLNVWGNHHFVMEATKENDVSA